MGMIFGKVAVEQPQHKVLHSTCSYHIWRYPPAVAAVVNEAHLPSQSTTRTDHQFSSDAFQTLARYIGVFGDPQNNSTSTSPHPQSIAMTAPVVMSPENTRSMKFLLPSKYTQLDSTPQPTDPAVHLELIPTRYEAVLPFSGNLNVTRATPLAAQLTQLLKKDGIDIIGQWTFQGYNPPITLPMLKRNEIHIPVDGARFETEQE